jgi:hypothetical protein
MADIPIKSLHFLYKHSVHALVIVYWIFLNRFLNIKVWWHLKQTIQTSSLKTNTSNISFCNKKNQTDDQFIKFWLNIKFRFNNYLEKSDPLEALKLHKLQFDWACTWGIIRLIWSNKFWRITEVLEINNLYIYILPKTAKKGNGMNENT